MYGLRAVPGLDVEPCQPGACSYVLDQNGIGNGGIWYEPLKDSFDRSARSRMIWPEAMNGTGNLRYKDVQHHTNVHR